MKSFTIILCSLISFNSYSFENLKDVKKINELSNSLSMERKYEGELSYRKHKEKQATQKVVELENNYSKLASKYRLSLSDNQYLKKQNDMLVNALKNSGNFNPEIATRLEGFKGRVPASAQEPEESSD